ncbi:unnamed protein product [Hyaloperonospora brassicae]|uniref:Uncharacterized protein n=1 Tax=Hyaloperonospora brassicae TaxID=162125 RepID=A0AAV0UWA5_HYABA|nr:unnamed protein product [Hyaloperonospora brassicae]
MLARTSCRLSKTMARNISNSAAARVQHHVPTTSSSSGSNGPQVSQTEKAWCDVYGVDYEKQIHEALQETPAVPESSSKAVDYPTATPKGLAQAQHKVDIWNVVFGTSGAT